MQTSNISINTNLCLSELIFNLIIIAAICIFLYKFLSKRTVNIENFDSSDKITYSIDGHPVNVN
jgi:hypothetical protein